MQRPTTNLRTFGTRVAELERRAPEWRTWLRLLAELERALDDPGWTSGAVAGPEVPVPSGSPLLHGRTLVVDAGRATRLLRRLLGTAAAERTDAAATLGRYRPEPDETLRLLEAAIRRDRAAIADLAAGSGTDPAALSAVADLAAVPPLHLAARGLRSGGSAFRPHGWCPVCGAWPLLAERRGLERARVLRCGRCEEEWQTDWLRCAFCGERDHERLGLLVAEEARESRRAETCAACRGYLKSVATLQPPGLVELLLLDLETVELDLAALDRGHGRPEGLGAPLDLRLAPRARRGRRFFADA